MGVFWVTSDPKGSHFGAWGGGPLMFGDKKHMFLILRTYLIIPEKFYLNLTTLYFHVFVGPMWPQGVNIWGPGEEDRGCLVIKKHMFLILRTYLIIPEKFYLNLMTSYFHVFWGPFDPKASHLGARGEFAPQSWVPPTLFINLRYKTF